MELAQLEWDNENHKKAIAYFTEAAERLITKTSQKDIEQQTLIY